MTRTLHPQPIKLPPDLLTASNEDFCSIPGQTAAIRFFDPNSLDDYYSLKNITGHKSIRLWMDDTGKLTKTDYRCWAGNHNFNSFLFAVHDTRVEPEEFNTIRGFVNIYSERSEKFRIKRLIKNKFLPKNISGKHILEISMATKPQSTGEIPSSGLISSAIRLSCLQVRAQFSYPNYQDLIIYAFIDHKNVPSLKTIEAAGFIKKGTMKYDPNSPQKTILYILSWRLLNQKVKNNLYKINLLLYPQITDSHCGPAVIQNLFAYNHLKFSQDEIVRAAKAQKTIIKNGLSPVQIINAVSVLAPKMKVLLKQNTTAKDLKTLIHYYHLPVVINWQGLFYNSVEEEKKLSTITDRGHYSIVVDINVKKDEITIADPYSEYYKKPRVFSYKWFKTRWWDIDKTIPTKKLIFVVVPQDKNLPLCHFTD